jgi:hypothetical protein
VRKRNLEENRRKKIVKAGDSETGFDEDQKS